MHISPDFAAPAPASTDPGTDALAALPGGIDLAIVGGGLAGTVSLLRILEHLAGEPARERPRTIAMFDREGDFFAGTPYGARAGRSSLTITSLEDFLPEPMLGEFIDWLARHKERILGGRLGGEEVDAAWLATHEADVRADRWRGTYVPRRFFGAFLREQTCAALERHAVRAEVRLVQAAVERLVPGDGGVRLEVAGRSVRAERVLLAVGSPPVRTLPREGEYPENAFIDSIHRPSLDAVLERVSRMARDEFEGRGRILLVGGNAEAMELIHGAHSTFPQEWATDRLTVLSPQGRPRHWRASGDEAHVSLPALDALAESAVVSALGIRQAVEADLVSARGHGLELQAVERIMARVVPLVDRLEPEETGRFVAVEGMAISDLLRQAGGDAVEALELRAEAGAVRFEAGRYHGARWEPGRGWRVSVGGPERVLPDHYAVIINATGFESVSGSRDPLLRSLIEEGTAQAAPGDRGLAVGPDFTCAPGIHVVGPLLAGNTDPRVWHLESARRIIGIADSAARAVTYGLRGDPVIAGG